MLTYPSAIFLVSNEKTEFWHEKYKRVTNPNRYPYGLPLGVHPYPRHSRAWPARADLIVSAALVLADKPHIAAVAVDTCMERCRMLVSLRYSCCWHKTKKYKYDKNFSHFILGGMQVVSCLQSQMTGFNPTLTKALHFLFLAIRSATGGLNR